MLALVNSKGRFEMMEYWFEDYSKIEIKDLGFVTIIMHW